MHTILIADDDKEDQFLLQMAFKENKIDSHIFFFDNGLELIHHLEETLARKQPLPAFILLDLNMPRMNGKMTVKALKSNPLLKAIPVIIFSTSGSQNDISDCYSLGVNSYQVKPDSFTKLVEMIALTCSFWLHTNRSLQYRLQTSPPEGKEVPKLFNFDLVCDFQKYDCYPDYATNTCFYKWVFILFYG